MRKCARERERGRERERVREKKAAEADAALALAAAATLLPGAYFIRACIYDQYSGSMQFTTHLDHIGHCTTTSGKDRSNRWTYRVFIMNTRCD